MRKSLIALTLVLMAFTLAGCPMVQMALVGTEWSVDVQDKNGQVSPYDDGDILGDLSGYWYFNADGTMTIYSDVESTLYGTYTQTGNSIEFTAQVDDSGTDDLGSWEEHSSISGTLAYDGTTLTGDGTYSTAFSSSDDPQNNYDFHGECWVDGSAQSGPIAWLISLIEQIFGISLA